MRSEVYRGKNIASLFSTDCTFEPYWLSSVYRCLTGFRITFASQLCKEHLELEIMNSKMSCIEKLLKPEVNYSPR